MNAFRTIFFVLVALVLFANTLPKQSLKAGNLGKIKERFKQLKQKRKEKKDKKREERERNKGDGNQKDSGAWDDVEKNIEDGFQDVKDAFGSLFKDDGAKEEEEGQK
jgi:hypothetical protein